MDRGGIRRAAGALAGSLLAFVSVWIQGPCEAQAAGVTNIRMEEVAGIVLVTYDLEGSVPIAVTLVGSSDGGKTFGLKVEAVDGDVGPSVAPGRAKRIVWRARRDHPAGLDGVDVVLDVRVAGPPAAKPPAGGPTYFVIPVRGHAGMEFTRSLLERALAEVERVRPTVLIAEIDSVGGLAAECASIIEMFRSWLNEHPTQRAAALIDGRARSGGAAFAAIWPEVYLTPSSVVGATAPEEGERWPLPVPEAGLQSVAGEALAAAQRYGRNLLLVEAAVSPGRMELWRADRGVGRADVAREPPSSEPDAEASRLCGPGMPLTLSAEQTVELGFATAVVNDYAALGQRMGLPNWKEASDFGRKVIGSREEENGRRLEDFADVYLTFQEAKERYTDPDNHQLSGKHSNYWAMCKALWEMIDRAHEASYLEGVLAWLFPRGTALAEAACRSYEKSLR